MEISPLTLDCDHVRLEPLQQAHAEALFRVSEPGIFTWMSMPIERLADMRAFVAEALDRQREGAALPFVMIERASGQAVGSTRFGAIVPAHRRVEIGWTWIARPWQGTAVNSEAKLLMLAHAFEEWDCVRVEFKTDALNTRSRAALVAIGASEEGVLRHHMVMAGGRLRDSVYYSILAEEWPRVRTHLRARLAQRAKGRAARGGKSQ